MHTDTARRAQSSRAEVRTDTARRAKSSRTEVRTDTARRAQSSMAITGTLDTQQQSSGAEWHTRQQSSRAEWHTRQQSSRAEWQSRWTPNSRVAGHRCTPVPHVVHRVSKASQEEPVCNRGRLAACAVLTLLVRPQHASGGARRVCGRGVYLDPVWVQAGEHFVIVENAAEAVPPTCTTVCHKNRCHKPFVTKTVVTNRLSQTEHVKKTEPERGARDVEILGRRPWCLHAQPLEENKTTSR